MQGDIQLQIARMQSESQERLLELQIRLQRDEREDQRERERARDERQMQMIQTIMTSMAGIVQGAIRPSHNDSS